MAEYEKAFQRLARDEGTSLSNEVHDRGGVTFFGISRKFHPEWIGWKFIDAGDTPPTEMVRDFYRVEYWNKITGDSIKSQRVAEALFGQYVNMGANAIKLAQTVVGTIADGKLGQKTLYALNTMDEERFLMMYCIANITRYHAIGMKDKTQRVFWAGWIKRGLSICQ